MTLRLSILVAALVTGAALLPASADAGTLDQQQTDTSGPSPGYVVGPVSGASSSAETFTAGLSGGLDQVDMFLDCFVCSNTVGVTVQITNAVGGAPGTTVLATASIPAVSVGPAPGSFISVAFGSPANVQAGTQYAIVAYTSGSDTYRWRGAAGTPYSGGQGFSSGSSPPGAWLAASKTFAFKTYVVPTPTASGPTGTSVSPTGQRAATLASCKKRARKHDWSKKRLRKCKRKANLLPV
jgi:hypothetical protein